MSQQARHSTTNFQSQLLTTNYYLLTATYYLNTPPSIVPKSICMKPEFSPLVTILFSLITVFLFGAAVQGLVVGLRGMRHPYYTSVLYLAILGMLTWLATLLMLSNNGFFAEFEHFPPRIMLALSVPLVTILALLFYRPFGELLEHLSPAALIYLQAFRILVELVLWLLFVDGICPQQMSFEGWNFDILAGLSAPIVAWIAFGNGRQNKTLAIVWNFVGLALLLNIIGIAILSLPQIGVMSPPNRMIVYWPMIWLPGFVAPFALMLHLLSLRQLLRK